MHTELGRIAALSEGVRQEPSPIERQVRRVAWLISGVAVAVGVAFLPLGWLAAGLPLHDAATFAVGLIVANVPEGLLPTITLALAVGVGSLARRGALVKRLSAVETLGSTAVICTDKTGTLTENRMRPVRILTAAGEVDLETDGDLAAAVAADPVLAELSYTLAACTTADIDRHQSGKSRGEATEVGLLQASELLGANVTVARRERHRRRIFRFDPSLRLMSTVDDEAGSLVVNAKGAPEAILDRAVSILRADGTEEPLDDERRAEVLERVERYAETGLRVLAVARRDLPAGRGAARGARSGRARARPARARRALRPAAARGRGSGRTLPRGRHPHHRDDRRLRPDGRRDRAPGRHRARRREGRDRRRARADERARARPAPARGRGARVRPQLTRGEAARRRRAARRGPGRRDDG